MSNQTSNREKEKENDTETRRQVLPRVPSRGRGKQRYSKLVAATERLLEQYSPDDVGLYQIAQEADVPPASVYHFFPTKEAAFFALAQKYLQGFERQLFEPVDASALSGWQDLLAWDFRRATKYYNRHRPALKIFLGGFGGEETRQADRQFNEKAAIQSFQRLGHFFEMPNVRDASTKFLIMLQILDAILQISYLKHGKITEAYYQEALSACVAYARLFLPEHVELREEFRDAVQKGEKIQIPESVIAELQKVTTGI